MNHNNLLFKIAASVIVVLFLIGITYTKIIKTNKVVVTNKNTLTAVENKTSNPADVVDLDNYAYYYNQGYDVFGKVLIKIATKKLAEKMVGDYDKLYINNLCYYPISKNSLINNGKFMVADNCGVVENTVNKKQPYQEFLTSQDLNSAREISDFNYDKNQVVQECESGDSNHYPQELIVCNTDWHSWLFDHQLNLSFNYPTPPNNCLGISSSKARSCYSAVDSCLNSCKEDYLSRVKMINQTAKTTEEQEQRLKESAANAGNCARSCLEEANLCCKQEFLSS